MNPNKELTFKQKLIQDIENFFKTNRILIWIIIGVVTVGIVGSIGFYTLNKNTIEKSTILVEDLMTKFNKWTGEKTETTKKELEAELLNQTSEILKKYPKSMAAQRALFVKGNYYYMKSEWEKALKEFLDVAKSFKSNVLAEEGLFNAAMCYEELSNPTEALKLHQDFQKTYKESYQIAYSIFSAGRISEQLQKYEDAAKYYQQLEDSYASSKWTKYAQNRLIFLQANNLYVLTK